MTATIRVPVNLRNPGEFLACCGLLECASRLWPASEGSFERSAFTLCLPAHGQSARTITDELLRAPVEKAPIAGVIRDGQGKPVKDPEKVSALRVGGPFQIRLAWWLDEERGRQSPFKLWSAHGTSLSILTALRDETTQLAATIESDKPFDRRTASSTRFGLDPGAGWNSLDAGFSPNEQKMRTLSSPLVELFAALALQRFVPVSTEGHGEVFRYSTWTIPCGAAVAAAVASGVVPGSTDRTFSFRIVDRGKFGCFTTATEITRTP